MKPKARALRRVDEIGDRSASDHTDRIAATIRSIHSWILRAPSLSMSGQCALVGHANRRLAMSAVVVGVELTPDSAQRGLAVRADGHAAEPGW
jgi:hypothetical protein